MIRALLCHSNCQTPGPVPDIKKAVAIPTDATPTVNLRIPKTTFFSNIGDFFATRKRFLFIPFSFGMSNIIIVYKKQPLLCKRFLNC